MLSVWGELAVGSRLGRGSRAGVGFLPGETLPGLCQCCVSRAAEEVGEVRVLESGVRALPPLCFPAPVGNPQH